MHEIVTIQIGEEANHLCAHFWNTQESYFTYTGQEESPVNHDVHFRPGIGVGGTDTFTPRTLIYDFKSAFGTLTKMNELYDDMAEVDADPQIWNQNSTVTHRQSPIEPSPYQRSLYEGTHPPEIQPGDVRYWSDYNRVYYHPRSIIQAYESDLSPEQKSFDLWSHGEELFRTIDKENDVFDEQLRPLVEECDQLQGFQMLTSVDNGWGGFASTYVDRIVDELGRKSFWVWTLKGPTPQARAQRLRRSTNEALSLYQMSNHTSAYVPIGHSPELFPSFISLDQQSRWSISALQSMAFESMTLPTRVKQLQNTEASTLDDLAAALNAEESQKISQLLMNLPDTLQVNGHSGPTPNGFGENPRGYNCEFAFTEKDASNEPHLFAQLENTRGETDDRIDFDDREGPRIKRIFNDLPYPLIDSFPRLFQVRQPAVSVKTSLCKTSTVSSWIQMLEAHSTQLLDLDVRETVADGLRSISEAYTFGQEFEQSEEDDLDD